MLPNKYRLTGTSTPHSFTVAVGGAQTLATAAAAATAPMPECKQGRLQDMALIAHRARISHLCYVCMQLRAALREKIAKSPKFGVFK